MTTQKLHANNSPLDSLKEAAIVIVEQLDLALDQLATNHDIFADDSYEGELIEGARVELARALAPHVPGLTVPDDARLFLVERELLLHAARYDDGSPIVTELRKSDVDLGRWYPRRNTDMQGEADRRIAALAEHGSSVLNEPPASHMWDGPTEHDLSGDWTGAETIDNIETAVQRLNAAAEPTNADQHVEVMAGIAEWEFDAEALAAVGVADERVARDLVNLLHAATHAVRGDVDPSIIVQSVGIIGGRIAHRIAGVDR